jgi:WD40 repeat protein
LNILSADKYVSTGVAFNRDGSRIVSVGSDLMVKLWDTAISQPLISLRGHPSTVYSVAFSPDGRWIASSDDTGLVKLWDGSPWVGTSAAPR